MHIKKPTPSDYDSILELWGICGIPSKPKGRDSYDRIVSEMKENPEYWKAVYKNEKIVGIVVGTDDGRKGWINRLAVHPEYRRKGMGKMLVESLEKEFDKKGLDIIGALVEGDNPGSMEFFEELCYEDIGAIYYSKRKSDES